MADSSLLSVIMPVLNGENFLAEAVASVQRAPGPLELIIVDDGSTDRTAEVAKGCENLIYIRQETAGPAAARNRGLQIARGDLIGFLDADDCWASGHPAAALNYLRSHREIDLVLGQSEFLLKSAISLPRFLPSGKRYHSYQLGAAIIRRRLFERIGGFDPQMRYGEDVDWFLRARESGAIIAMLPELSLHYRLHSGNRPNVYRTSRIGLLDAFHHSLQRRRGRSDTSSTRTGRPLVSVIIPVFNGESFIAAAIESVLAQDYRPLELIVVDDGSTDKTRDIVRQIPLATLLEQPHQGAGAARNAGVQASKGEFIAFLDADDLWTARKLSRQMKVLANDAKLEAAFGHVAEFDHGNGDTNRRVLPGPMPGTMLIRRTAFERIGWFDNDPRALEGVDWYLRASEKLLRTLMLPDVLYRRRVHGRNRGVLDRDHDGYVRAIKASLDRRRARRKRDSAC